MKLKIAFVVDDKNSFLHTRAVSISRNLNSEIFSSEIFYFNTIKKNKKTLINFIKTMKDKFQIAYFIDLGNSKLFTAIILKMFFNIKIIIDIGDDYYLLNKNKNTPVFKLFKIRLIQALFLKTADIIITRGFFHKKYLSEKLHYKNVFQFPDSIDPNHSYRRDTKQLKKKLNIKKNELVIGVMGSLNWNKKYEMCYGWDLIEALPLIKDLKIKIVIIGDGDGKKHLLRTIEKENLTDKVIFTGTIKYKILPEYLSLFDIGISTQTNNSVGWFRTTGKLPEYLAHEVYVIATNVGEASIRLTTCGSLLHYNGIKDKNYPKLLAKEIRKLYKNRKLLSKKAGAGRKIAEKYFSYPVNTAELEKIILSTVKK